MGVDIRITLTAFTVLAPAGAIAFLLLTVLILMQRKREPWVERLEHWLVVPLAVCMVGLVASATHLGTPGNALYVFNGWGRSPLSNEVASAVGFLLIAGAYWHASFSGRVPLVLNRLWLAVSCVAALWLVASISVVYAIPTIPPWNSKLVPFGFWTLSFTTGPLVTLATLALAKRTEAPRLPKEQGLKAPPSTARSAMSSNEVPKTPLAPRSAAAVPPDPGSVLPLDLPLQRRYVCALLCCSALALVATLVILVVQHGELAQLRNAFGTAAELAPWNGWAIAAFGLLGLLGIIVLAAPILRRKSIPLATALTAVVLMLVGASFVRVAFYSLHMTI